MKVHAVLLTGVVVAACVSQTGSTRVGEEVPDAGAPVAAVTKEVPPPRIAFAVRADPESLAELRESVTANGARAVEVPRGGDGGMYLWNADYVVVGELPSLVPDASYAPEVDVTVRMVRQQETATVHRERLNSEGVTYVGRKLSEGIDSDWRERADKGVAFEVIGEGLSYPQVKKVERALSTSPVISRSRTQRYTDGVALFDVTIPPHVSPHELAQTLEGLKVGEARAKVVRVTDEAVHISLIEEPAAP